MAGSPIGAPGGTGGTERSDTACPGLSEHTAVGLSLYGESP